MIIDKFRHLGDNHFIGILASNEGKDISVMVLIKIFDNENHVVHIIEANTQKMNDQELEKWVEANILVLTEELKIEKNG